LIKIQSRHAICVPVIPKYPAMPRGTARSSPPKNQCFSAPISGGGFSTSRRTLRAHRFFISVTMISG
ncbi:MAG: hypothetical protein RSB78_06500, partial [Oscillospiraceae bacterium]